jgi:type I restriction enzyme M protein
MIVMHTVLAADGASSMITGDIKSRSTSSGTRFWTGVISNPLELIERITYLLFVRQ